jgi:histidine triad (HIT) family protein
MKCEYCDMLERKDAQEIIYEDAEVVVAIKDFCAIPGQITVFPKQHFTILEMVPDDILQKCFILANKVSVAIFESMGVQGTNLLVANGLGAGQKVPHFAVEVIPRREGDGLNLQWPAKELSEDDKETAFLLLKEEADKLVDIGKKKEKKEEPKKELSAEKLSDKDDKGEKKENYLLKSLRKIP